MTPGRTVGGDLSRWPDLRRRYWVVLLDELDTALCCRRCLAAALMTVGADGLSVTRFSRSTVARRFGDEPAPVHHRLPLGRHPAPVLELLTSWRNLPQVRCAWPMAYREARRSVAVRALRLASDALPEPSAARCFPTCRLARMDRRPLLRMRYQRAEAGRCRRPPRRCYAATPTPPLSLIPCGPAELIEAVGLAGLSSIPEV